MALKLVKNIGDKTENFPNSVASAIKDKFHDLYSSKFRLITS